MSALLGVFDDWQHAALLGGATVGGALVGIGILLETKRGSLAAILVLIGVIIEPIFTLWLFAYDENISRAQKFQIACLEEAGAWRITEGLNWKKFKAELNKSAPHTIQLWILKSDPEIAALALNLEAALMSTPWHFIADEVSIPGDPPGLFVMSVPPVMPGREEENQDTQKFAAALKAANLVARVGYEGFSMTPNERQSLSSTWRTGDPAPTVKVIIGPKAPKDMPSGCTMLQ